MPAIDVAMHLEAKNPNNIGMRRSTKRTELETIWAPIHHFHFDSMTCTVEHQPCNALLGFRAGSRVAKPQPWFGALGFIIFPSCQVRVVRFLRAVRLFFSFSRSSSLRHLRRRLGQLFVTDRSGSADLTGELASQAGSAGPRQRRTSFRAGWALKGLSRQKKCRKICRAECPKIWRKECQQKCQKDMSEDMSGRNVRRYVRQDVRQTVRRNVKKECQKICQKKCPKKCQKICQKRMSRDMSEKMSGDMSEKNARRNVRRFIGKMSEEMSEQNVRRYGRQNVRRNVRRICQKKCPKICQKFKLGKESQKICQKNVKICQKNVRRYARKSVRRNVRKCAAR